MMNNQTLNLNRLLEFNIKTIEDYEKSIFVDKFVYARKVEESDDTFVKIGLRPLIEKEMFLPQTGPVFLAPQIIGLGRSIAIGELKYFVKRILEDPDVEKISLKLEDLIPRKIYDLLGDLSEGRILIPVTLWTKWLTSESWKGHLRFKNRELLLGSLYPVHSISTDLLKDKVILIDRFAAIWNYFVKLNKYTKKKERLQIKIGGERDKKIDVTVMSVNKFEIRQKHQIKIIQFD